VVDAMKLSEHFELSELLHSQTAIRKGIDNTPTSAIVAELQRLAVTILEPLREHVGRPVVISSGYRSPALNRAVGGSPNSAHMRGRAADLTVPGMKVREVCLAIVELRLPFDQVIMEGGAWCHVAIGDMRLEPRREQLTAVFGPGGTQYLVGIA
jgi:zinc D-Ala-D-Ala carboxypeptidase